MAIREEDLATLGVVMPGSGIAGARGATHMFYIQPDGWISAGSIHPNDLLNYMRGGWRPLPGYARFNWQPWYQDHPLEALFIQGGSKELPVDQIIQNSMHLKPPTVPGCGKLLTREHPTHNGDCWSSRRTVKFPQLQDPPAPVQCDFCERVSATEAANRNHTLVMHQADRAPQQLANHMAQALASALRGFVGAAALPCGICEQSFASPELLTAHVLDTHVPGLHMSQPEPTVQEPESEEEDEAEDTDDDDEEDTEEDEEEVEQPANRIAAPPLVG